MPPLAVTERCEPTSDGAAAHEKRTCAMASLAMVRRDEILDFLNTEGREPA